MYAHTKLRDLGLNEKEIKLYVTLLKHGKISPTHLSKLTKINRATVYSVAKNLQSKGLIQEDSSGKTFLTPLPPRQLKQLIERPRQELLSKEKLLKEAIEELSLLAVGKEYAIPSLQFIQEGEIKDFLYNNTLKWQESVIANDGVWWGFQDHSFVEEYEDWIDWTWTTPQSKKKEYSARVLSNSSDIEKKLQKKYQEAKREVRPWPHSNFASTMWIPGDYVVVVMTKKYPHYLFEIHDKILAQNLREIFQKLWG